MLRIFVSYTTRDKYLNIKRLRDVYNIIKQLDVIKQLDNIYVYIDLLNNSNAENRQKKVEEELSSSSIVIFLETPAASKSSWFIKEKKLTSKFEITSIEISISNLMNWNDTQKHIKETLEKRITDIMKDQQYLVSNIS